MTKKGLSIKHVAPVMMAAFVMSFCDLVGIGVDRVKLDFDLSNTMAQLIPSAVFLWFFVLSVPVGVLQDRIGKRNMVNLGMIITFLGLFLPWFFYTFETVLAGFALLGIGNTIVQVSVNPLLVDVSPERKSSLLSFSQFVKAVGSMIAPPLAGWLAAQYGDWRLLFPVFGVVSAFSVVWLATVKIQENRNTEQRATFSSSFRLLGNRYLLMMVMGIFLVVGIDVGINAVSGQFLLSRFQSEQTLAESGRSLYFFGKMLGTFGGAFLLARFSSRNFFIWSAIAGLISLLALTLTGNETVALIIIFLTGLGIANIFPLIFSLSVDRYPGRANEISGLMVMAISGGAAIPPLIGWVTDMSMSATSGIFVLAACAVYLTVISFLQPKTAKINA